MVICPCDLSDRFQPPSPPGAGIKCYMMAYSGFKGFKMHIFCALIVVRAHHLHTAPLKGRRASELAER